MSTLQGGGMGQREDTHEEYNQTRKEDTQAKKSKKKKSLLHLGPVYMSVFQVEMQNLSCIWLSVYTSTAFAVSENNTKMGSGV